MKDYSRLIIWVDYFNSSLSRAEGRRVPLSMAVKNPSLKELSEAAKRAGYDPEEASAAYPKRPVTRSGYISIERRKAKSSTIRELAPILSKIRGEQRR